VRDFSFLKDSPARQDVVLGDARMALEAEAPQGYDILVLDAFSGDSIPVHLLTLEAIQVYLRHLAPNGVLCLNVSNRFLDLPPVLKAAAQRSGCSARLVYDPGDVSRMAAISRWILVTRNTDAKISNRIMRLGRSLMNVRDIPAWTDDRSDLVRLLR